MEKPASSSSPAAGSVDLANPKSHSHMACSSEMRMFSGLTSLCMTCKESKSWITMVVEHRMVAEHWFLERIGGVADIGMMSMLLMAS